MKKTNKNTLYLEKMGCDFFCDDEINKVSDLNNYRYYIHNIKLKNNLNIEKLKNNKNIILDTLEVGRGARYIYTNSGFKRADDFGCWFNTYYRDDDDVCWSLIDINNKLNKGNYNTENIYTKETILKLVNSISEIQYTNIEEV